MKRASSLRRNYINGNEAVSGSREYKLCYRTDIKFFEIYA